MKCPQCGYKIKQDACPYCNIKSKEVIFASNKKAKKLLQANMQHDVHYTTKVPTDVSKTKMLLLTVFLGGFGAGNFYIGRRKRGLFTLISFVIGIISSYLRLYYFDNIILLRDIASIGAFFAVAAVFLWFSDAFAVLINRFDYPVVLASDADIKKAEKQIAEKFYNKIDKKYTSSKQSKIKKHDKSNNNLTNKKDK